MEVGLDIKQRVERHAMLELRRQHVDQVLVSPPRRDIHRPLPARIPNRAKGSQAD